MGGGTSAAGAASLELELARAGVRLCGCNSAQAALVGATSEAAHIAWLHARHGIMPCHVVGGVGSTLHM